MKKSFNQLIESLIYSFQIDELEKIKLLEIEIEDFIKKANEEEILIILESLN